MKTGDRPRLRERLFKAQDGKCFWCGRQMNLTKRGSTPRKSFCTIDHVFLRGDPRRQDHKLHQRISPHVAACNACNSERGDTPFEEFAKIKGIALCLTT